jgi:hypothetical protein
MVSLGKLNATNGLWCGNPEVNVRGGAIVAQFETPEGGEDDELLINLKFGNLYLMVGE